MRMPTRPIPQKRGTFLTLALFLAAIFSLSLILFVGARPTPPTSPPLTSLNSVQAPIPLGAPVGALPVSVQGQGSTLPNAPAIAATKRDTLLVDVNNNGLFDP